KRVASAANLSRWLSKYGSAPMTSGPHFEFECLSEGCVNISASACLKYRSFDPKQCLSFSRLASFFGAVWIAGVHQHCDQCSAWYDLVDKVDLFDNETVRHADNARNIAARLH